MQVSGFSDNRHRTLNKAQPVYRPAKKSPISANMTATMAVASNTGGLSRCAAAAAPAATRAMAAGAGNPKASARTTRKIRTYPCAATKVRRPFMSNYRVHEKRRPEAAQLGCKRAYIAGLD